MSRLLVQLRPGLGDNLICAGLLREYARTYESVSLLSLPRNFASVSFLYRDVKNITVLSVEENRTNEFLARERVHYTEVRRIGFEGLTPDGGNWERQFYKLAGVDYTKKWSGFFVERDRVREEALFHKVAPAGDYIFLHEDRPRNYRIERRLIGATATCETPRGAPPKGASERGGARLEGFASKRNPVPFRRGTEDRGFPIVEPKENLTDNIFDYGALIERAKEIHVIDSSFMYLVDLLPYQNPDQKLFVHRYARENVTWKLPILRKNWQVVTLNGNRTGWKKHAWAALDALETFLLCHRFSKRVTRKIYRSLGWRVSSQRTATAEQEKM